MALEEIGIGAGGGLLGTILGYFGISKRLDSIEKRVDDNKKEIIARVVSLEEQALYRDVHAECSHSWHNALGSIEKKLDILLSERRTKT